jgi:hypothetical protein
MRKWRVGILPVASAVIVMSCLASCQAVFTFSPLSFLQRDPGSLSATQQVEFAREALQSGDAAAMGAVYDSIATAATADPENAGLQYTAAQLALELSGVGDVFSTLLGTLGAGGGEGIDPFALSDELFASLNLTRLGEAGVYLLAADSAATPADLSATDYLVGAVGLLIAGAPVLPDSTTAPDIVATIDQNDNLDSAEQFLQAGVDELPADDPARAVLQSLIDALNGGGPV